MSVEMHVDEVLLWCLQQNYHADKMNAAIHCAPVRFSPITFRLAEHLWQNEQWHANVQLREIILDLGAYEEDKGR